MEHIGTYWLGKEGLTDEEKCDKWRLECRTIYMCDCEGWKLIEFQRVAECNEGSSRKRRRYWFEDGVKGGGGEGRGGGRGRRAGGGGGDRCQGPSFWNWPSIVLDTFISYSFAVKRKLLRITTRDARAVCKQAHSLRTRRAILL
jgi:hypothetical protein